LGLRLSNLGFWDKLRKMDLGFGIWIYRLVLSLCNSRRAILACASSAGNNAVPLRNLLTPPRPTHEAQHSYQSERGAPHSPLPELSPYRAYIISSHTIVMQDRSSLSLTISHTES
jgi:hypothetical protein